MMTYKTPQAAAFAVYPMNWHGAAQEAIKQAAGPYVGQTLIKLYVPPTQPLWGRYGEKQPSRLAMIRRAEDGGYVATLVKVGPQTIYDGNPNMTGINLVRIESPDGLASGTGTRVFLQHDGGETEIQGVTKVDLRIRPNEMITAVLEVFHGKVDCFAEAQFDRASVERFAERLGLVVVDPDEEDMRAIGTAFLPSPITR